MSCKKGFYRPVTIDLPYEYPTYIHTFNELTIFKLYLDYKKILLRNFLYTRILYLITDKKLLHQKNLNPFGGIGFLLGLIFHS